MNTLNHDEAAFIIKQAGHLSKYTCPTCGGKAVMTCKCRIGNKVCANNHDWHYVDGKPVLGTGHGDDK